MRAEIGADCIFFIMRNYESLAKTLAEEIELSANRDVR